MIEIHLLSRQTLYNIISKNHKYYETFSIYDWIARKVRNYTEYLYKIMLSVVEFTDTEIKKIEKAVTMADEKIDEMSVKYPSGWNWLNWKRLKKIKWKIGCVYGPNYEGGFPHTVDDTIILSKNIVKTYDISSLACLLIHEKIHIYQRTYPKDVKMYLKLNNFKIYRKKRKTDRFRANPDADSYIYERKGEIYSLEYNYNKIRDINDVKNRYGKKITRKEHPYEEMAYFVEKICKNI
jgi:hypothetical protein